MSITLTVLSFSFVMYARLALTFDRPIIKNNVKTKKKISC